MRPLKDPSIISGQPITVMSGEGNPNPSQPTGGFFGDGTTEDPYVHETDETPEDYGPLDDYFDPGSGDGTGGNSAPSSSKGLNDYDFQKWFDWLYQKAMNGDADALDKLINFIFSEKSSSSALQWAAEREDSQYQRMVKDMQKAGLNPWLLTSGVGGQSTGYTGHSYSNSGFGQSQRSLKSLDQSASQGLLSGVMSLISMIAMVMMFA